MQLGFSQSIKAQTSALPVILLPVFVHTGFQSQGGINKVDLAYVCNF